MMETVNDLTKSKTEIANEELSVLVRVLAPFAPFVTEELWNKLGGEFSVHVAGWPKYEEKYLVSETIILSVQINGKLRGVVEVAPDATEEIVQKAAEAQEKIKKYLTSGTACKVIYIQGKTINFVIT
jgi:leucyl-tRNA synthetase